MGDFSPRECGACMEHYFDNPNLVHAAASVGIERGASTATIVYRYLAAFHRSGHRDETGGRGR
jgi:hypothetical protein